MLAKPFQVVAIAALAVLGAQQPAEANALRAGGASGHPFRLIVEGSWDKNCAPKSFPQISVVQSPAHGSLSMQSDAFTIRRSVSGEARCIGRPGNGQAVYYTSQPGFHGMDHAALTVTFPDGVTENKDVTISVR